MSEKFQQVSLATADILGDLSGDVLDMMQGNGGVLDAEDFQDFQSGIMESAGDAKTCLLPAGDAR